MNEAEVKSRIGADLDRNGIAPDGMTPLQRKFADCYLANLADGMGRGIKQHSALEAGYAESDAKSAAWRNLRTPAVVQYMAGLLSAATGKVKLGPEYVLFKAMMVVEEAEGAGAQMAKIRALELIARHVDVAALINGRGTGPAGDSAINTGSMTLPFDPDKLTVEELTQMLELMKKATRGPVSK